MSILYNILAVLAVLSLGASLGAVVMAWFAAASDADEMSERWVPQQDEAKRRDEYRNLQRKAAQ